MQSKLLVFGSFSWGPTSVIPRQGQCSDSSLTVRSKQAIWVIDQARGQDGWIFAKFFFCVFMDRDEVEVQKHSEKRTRPISSHHDRTSLVNKGLIIIWVKTPKLDKVSLRNKARIPSG